MITIIYDRECPLCHAYNIRVRVQDALGEIELVNAREDSHPLVAEATKRGYDLDKGFLVIHGEQWYYGADAVQFLSLMSTRSGIFNRLMGWLFKRQWLIKLCYPLFRAARNIAIFLKGKKQIRNLD